jgi:threonine synthase
LSRELGLGSGAVWIKDETGNVSGSHKGRHLFGVALWLAVVERLGLAPEPPPPLAIASCGNAALAAAVVARAAGRPLEVYVPPDAHPAVLERLRALGAHLQVCPRSPGVAGDPCYHAFRGEVANRALPFSCQGSDNGLIFDGGATLAWEMVSELLRQGKAVDRLFVQVGGGALASSVWRGLHEAHHLGLLAALPRIHAVQTRGAYPLVRAWDLLSRRILAEHLGLTQGEIVEDPAQRARRISEEVPEAQIRQELAWAARHRSTFMWPWEEEPRSRASGILDDETYDWRAVVEAMLLTGGHPLVVAEDSLEKAENLAQSAGIQADATGAASLAGALELAQAKAFQPQENLAVLLTGAKR